MEKITVYWVIYDMEDDVPDAYVYREEDAKKLLEGNDIGDYCPIEITSAEWMNLMYGKSHETK